MWEGFAKDGKKWKMPFLVLFYSFFHFGQRGEVSVIPPPFYTHFDTDLDINNLGVIDITEGCKKDVEDVYTIK